MTANNNATSGNYPSADGLNTSAIALVALISTVLVFAVIVLLIVVFNHVEQGVVSVKDTSKPFEELDQLRLQQQGSLLEHGLLDREKQRYAIPLSRAMELTVQRRRQNPLGPPGTPPDQGTPPKPGAVELPTEAVEGPEEPNDEQ